MAQATPADVAARLGRELSPEEISQVRVLLDDAELRLRSRIPDLLAQVAHGTLDRATVVMVEATMVARVVRNPEGYTQESDGNYSYMINTQVASGRLSVLDDEWALLGMQNSVFLIVPRVQIPPSQPPPCPWWPV